MKKIECNFLKKISLVLLIVQASFSSQAQLQNSDAKDSIIQFIFTSDVHFGLTKEKFQNKTKVSAFEVNNAMAYNMSHIVGNILPKDNGIGENEIIKGIDALVITGDITNRMENGVQAATQSWEEFKTVYLKNLHLKKSDQKEADLFLVPGNHDISNAIGFHRPMLPKKDPAAMIGIYNLMFPNKLINKYDSVLNTVHYSKDIKGVHFIFLSLYPDSAERVWMEKDLAGVATSTPVLLFAHSIPEAEPRFFENPNGFHDINEEDKFENLVLERYKEGKDVKGPTTIEQNGFTDFIKLHPNIKAYFHGHENFTQFYTYQGPKKDINLNCIRTDSPMKGRISLKDETKLAYEIVTISTNKKALTIREVLWNTGNDSSKIQWGSSATINL
ncbi:MAG: hypothetical protein RLZ56_274 [Bacteroidota bacterium]|jgi:hypothetical protein